MMSDPSDIGMALRTYRIKARINQAVLARSLGVSQSQISRWESGRDRPRAHNEEAIRALIWGRPDPHLASLAFFVRTAAAPLALFDDAHRSVAMSAALSGPDAPFSRLGWAFDPLDNPDFAPIFRDYRALLACPEGAVVGLEICVPFEHEGRAWIGRAHKTIYPIEGRGVCLAEIHFEPAGPESPQIPTLKRIRPPRPVVQMLEGSGGLWRASL